MVCTVALEKLLGFVVERQVRPMLPQLIKTYPLRYPLIILS